MPRAAVAPSGRVGDRLLHGRFHALAAALGIAYLVAPLDAHGAHLLYHRFLPPAFILALFLAAPAGRPAGIATLVFALAAPVASLVTIGPAALAYSALVRDYDALLPYVERGSAVLNFDVERTGADLVRGVDLQAHAVAVRGGRSAFDFTQSPISPAVLALDRRWDESTGRLLRSDFRPSLDMSYYRYAFVHLKNRSASALTTAAMAPDARLVATAGEWMLFESTRLRVPVSSAELPAPSPLPASFFDRFRQAGAGRAP
jgi:hypothetical protein